MKPTEFLSKDHESSHLAQYSIKCAKLVKFKDTKLEAVQFTQSGSKGKLLITFARDPSKSRPTLRFHKIRNVKQLQSFDFNTDANLDYKFSDLVETTRIELK